MSTSIDLSRDWSFRPGRVGWFWVRGYDCVGCFSVDLPHSWNSVDTFQEGIEYYRGPGGYRKTFTLSPECNGTRAEGTWILESEGFYGTGDIWLNRRKVADIDGEYLGFCLDVGKFLVPGDNLLAVRLTNRCRSYVLPGIKMPDFLLHGGLAGRVFLRRQPAWHLDRNSLQIRVEGVARPSSTVRTSAMVHNSSTEAGSVVVRWTIADPDGCEVGRREIPLQEMAPHNGYSHASAEFEVSSARLWSVARPWLYSAKCEILHNGTVTDEYVQKFGFRSAVFEPGKGFFLNGVRTELRGCNRHESMPGFGNAMPRALHREDVRLLKETGCNIVRLSHYPQSPAFLDACDQMGLMVYAEIATWKSVRTGRWLKRALRQLERMILRDRNRPSIVLWGMGNESRSRKAYVELGKLARSLDPSRPITYAENHMHRAVRERTADIPDVWCCNYELDVLDAACAASRLKTTLVSECSNMPTAARGNVVEELKQVEVIERDLAILANKEYNSGCLIWCMNDYATLRKKRYLRYSGIMDAWRVPKMASALLQALWSDVPFIKICGDMWIDSGADPSRARCEIHVFSNCSRVVLTRNGREVFSTQESRPHLVVQVEPDIGRLIATGTSDGRVVSDFIDSHGSAFRIGIETVALPCEATEHPVLAAEIRILDEFDAICSNWNGNVLVKTAGAARLCAHTADGSIPVSGGVGRTFVLGKEPGASAIVDVSCAGLIACHSEVNFS